MRNRQIIAVMSSNVDDLLYGCLLVGAEATNSVLQQLLVGKQEHGTFQVLREKGFEQDEDFGIRVTAKDNAGASTTNYIRRETWLDTKGYCTLMYIN